MTDYLSRFDSRTWRKLDPELIRRWEWDARYNGDKTIKTQASNAKRAATTMQKTSEQFTNLKPDHTLTLPNSVIDMFEGSLGMPEGGWPPKIAKIILQSRKSIKGRPGAKLTPVDLIETFKKSLDS